MKKFLKFLILTLIMGVLWIVSLGIGMSIFGVDSSANQESSSNALLLLLVVSAINTSILYFLIKKSKWYGWRLVLIVATVLFGVQFFLSQIEAYYFNESLGMPVALIYSLVLGGAILAVSFSIVAVKLLGKWKKISIKPDEKIKWGITFIVKVIILAVLVYPALYFTAGYFIAWQFDELRVLYSGSNEILPFFEHFFKTFKADPLLYPLQIFRGFLWIGLAFLVMRSVRLSWVKTALLVGLIFAIIMNSQHLIPNPYMPGLIPLYHFIETSISNFIWGFLIVWVFARSIKWVEDDTSSVLQRE